MEEYTVGAYTCAFDGALPYLLQMGMPCDLYWTGDPWLVSAYWRADQIRRQRTSEEQWLQGLYFYDALDAVAYNLTKKKGKRPAKYMEQPVRVVPETAEEKKRRALRERRRTIEYFNNLQKKFQRQEG